MEALLLMGAGINNLGAVRACGLNAEEAKRHLRAAMGEDGRGARGVGAQASEALAWCQMEVNRSGASAVVPLSLSACMTSVSTI